MRAINKIRPVLVRNCVSPSHNRIIKVVTSTVGDINNNITIQPFRARSHVISQQKFHSSSRDDSTAENASSTGTRVRRRRVRRGASSQINDLTSQNDNGGNKSTEERTSSNGGKNGPNIRTFLPAARKFLARTEKALEPMKRTNDVFIIKRDSNEQGDNLTLRLKPGEGNYILQVDEEMLTLTLSSPMSGIYTYVLCPKTGSFIGMDDGHIAEGMIVRDLIRHCTGMPQF